MKMNTGLEVEKPVKVKMKMKTSRGVRGGSAPWRGSVLPIFLLHSCIPAHSTMIYTIGIFIVIIFFITTITYITWLVWHYSVVAPPLQPEDNAETEINNAMLSTWPTLTYTEAKSRDP